MTATTRYELKRAAVCLALIATFCTLVYSCGSPDAAPVRGEDHAQP